MLKSISRRDFMKGMMAGGVALGSAGLLSACGSSSSSSSESSTETTTEETSTTEESTGFQEIEETAIDTERETTETTGEKYPKITLAISTDPQDLNPWNVNSGSKSSVYCYIYEALFDYDAENYYPVLAKGYTVTDDYHWDVEIYDYIYDSEGNHITADDVVYSYQVQIDSGYAAKFDMFESIEKLDEYTVRFTWNKVIDGVCEVEWPLCNIKVFAQAAYDSGNFSTAPVATGPYYVESFTSGSSVILKANESYWQTEEDLIAQGHHQTVEEIDIMVITEEAQQVIALQNETIDFSTAVSDENMDQFMDGGAYDEQYNVYAVPGSMGYYLMGNMGGDSIWSDINFRLAVYYALDNDVIAQVTSLPACTIPGSSKWTTYVEAWEGNDDSYLTTYDPDLAAEYLAASSYGGETVSLITQNEEVFKNAATMIQSLLAQIGIDVEINAVTDTEMSATTSTTEGYDLLLSRSGGPSLIGSWNKMFNTADFTGSNSIGMLSDDTLFELYAVANTAEGYNVENMTALWDYVVENAYCDFLVYATSSWVYTSNIASLGFSPVDDLRLNDCVYYID